MITRIQTDDEAVEAIARHLMKQQVQIIEQMSEPSRSEYMTALLAEVRVALKRAGFLSPDTEMDREKLDRIRHYEGLLIDRDRLLDALKKLDGKVHPGWRQAVITQALRPVPDSATRGEDHEAVCPRCGAPSASPPAEVHCVECATEGWEHDADARRLPDLPTEDGH